MRDIVFVRDGVDVDEMRGVRSGRSVGVLADGKIVEVMDQSAKDGGIVRGQVEGSRVCFLETASCVRCGAWRIHFGTAGERGIP